MKKLYGSLLPLFFTPLLLAGCGHSTHKTIIPFKQYQARVQPLVKAMSLDEKLGQMTLPKFTMIQQHNRIKYQLIERYHLGALLGAGGEVPNGKGGVLSGMDEAIVYQHATLAQWQQLLQNTKAHPVVVKLANQLVEIPLLLGVDAVHGDYNVLGATLFPQNIGLSMTHDPHLLKETANWTAHDVLVSGFNWVYAPTVAITHNPNWGRTYETLGSTPRWTRRYAAAIVAGLQQNDAKHGTINGVLATVKHYIGDGATWNGIDEGNDHVKDVKRFLSVNFAGYEGALDSDAGSIMISYSAINHLPMSFNRHYLTTILKGGKAGRPFNGLLVSDYGAAYKAGQQGLPATSVKTPYPVALAKTINAGMDLIMLSNAASYKTIARYLTILKQDVKSGLIPISRINDAVTHILAMKYAMGLIHQNKDGSWVSNQRIPFKSLSAQSERKTASRVAEESFVLLKNHHRLLPLNFKKIQYIILIGERIIPTRHDNGRYVKTLFQNYNNIGAQNGGWTIAWQGMNGNAFWQGKNKKRSGATSVLDGLRMIAPQAKIIYPHYRSFTNLKLIAKTRAAFLNTLKQNYSDMNQANTVMIGVLAEVPYAEFMGDISSPYCRDNKTYDHGCLYNLHFNPSLPLQQKKSLAIKYSRFDQKILTTLKNQHTKLPMVTILLSGRPMIIQEPLRKSDAMIAAWLPGTSGGEALANALSGRYRFRQTTDANSLSVQWVRNMHQLKNYPIYSRGKGFVMFQHPLFKIGYGLAD